jgi:hypothetical protein
LNWSLNPMMRAVVFSVPFGTVSCFDVMQRYIQPVEQRGPASTDLIRVTKTGGDL